MKVKSLSRVGPSATPWIAAYQAPPSMGFSREEYWSGVPLPSPDLGPTLALILSPVFCFNCFFFPAFPCILKGAPFPFNKIICFYQVLQAQGF